MIGKLQRVPLREVWKHEALGLTRWLEENIDVLNEVLGLSLSDVERETPAGSLNVDLVAKDDNGDRVIIENQLEKSDHDHLGKIITYLTALNAQKAIWIVADHRPEHVGAINWLNQTSAASFYLVKIEGVRIGDSPPAPLLTPIVGPSEEGRAVGKTKKDMAEREVMIQRFWKSLLERAKNRTSLHADLTPPHGTSLLTGAGKSGLQYDYDVNQHAVFVGLWITRNKAETKAVFDALAGSKDDVEREFGESLRWNRHDEKKNSWIGITWRNGGWRDEAKWPEVQDAMIDAMIRLEKALRPYIAKLRI